MKCENIVEFFCWAFIGMHTAENCEIYFMFFVWIIEEIICNKNRVVNIIVLCVESESENILFLEVSYDWRI